MTHHDAPEPDGLLAAFLAVVSVFLLTGLAFWWVLGRGETVPVP